CRWTGSFGGGCGADMVCAPLGGLSACISTEGAVSCQGGYTQRRLVGTKQDIQDGRGCTTCSCDSPTAQCTNGALSFYAPNSCPERRAESPDNADNNCDPPPASTYNAYQYTATAINVTCPAPQKPTPTGSVTLNGSVTTCCAP